MIKKEYTKYLEKEGYIVCNDYVYHYTPEGILIQKIKHLNGAFALSTVTPPEKSIEFQLTQEGKEKVNLYIKDLEEKREELLPTHENTTEEAAIPNVRDIESDISFVKLNDHLEYLNDWEATDDCEADSPLILNIGKDFVPTKLAG